MGSFLALFQTILWLFVSFAFWWAERWQYCICEQKYNSRDKISSAYTSLREFYILDAMPTSAVVHFKQVLIKSIWTQSWAGVFRRNVFGLGFRSLFMKQTWRGGHTLVLTWISFVIPVGISVILTYLNGKRLPSLLCPAFPPPFGLGVQGQSLYLSQSRELDYQILYPRPAI